MPTATAAVTSSPITVAMQPGMSAASAWSALGRVAGPDRRPGETVRGTRAEGRTVMAVGADPEGRPWGGR
jgi:hypothetical protein